MKQTETALQNISCLRLELHSEVARDALPPLIGCVSTLQWAIHLLAAIRDRQREHGESIGVREHAYTKMLGVIATLEAWDNGTIKTPTE